MTTAQLRLLAKLGLQDNPNALEKLQIRLVRILLDRGDKRIAHGPGGAVRNGGVGARLVVLAAAPADNIGRAGLAAQSLLIGVIGFATAHNGLA